MNMKLAFKALLWPLSICGFVGLLVGVAYIGAWISDNVPPWMFFLGACVSFLGYVWYIAYTSLKAKAENEAYYKANPGRGGDYR